MKRYKNAPREAGGFNSFTHRARRTEVAGGVVAAHVQHTAAAVGCDDAELLRSYDRSGDELAFSKLVQRYQAMVLGTAFRRTGSVDLAQEVAQEVFAALARKARFLSGRASLGGWLHQAAVFESAHVLKSEMRRGAREERFAKDWEAAATASGRLTNLPEPISVLDEALDDLAPNDREALILRYFQDLSYSEMGNALSVSEVTVRQRVSRAVERLGHALRARGVTKNPVAILLGAVAIESTLTAPAGLAAAALAVAAAGGGSSAFLLLTALLPYASSKGAAVALGVLAAAVLWPVAKPDATSAEAAIAMSNRSSARDFGPAHADARRVQFAAANPHQSRGIQDRAARATRTDAAFAPVVNVTAPQPAPRAVSRQSPPIASATLSKRSGSSTPPPAQIRPAPAHARTRIFASDNDVAPFEPGSPPGISAGELGLSGALAAAIESRGMPEMAAELREAEHVPIKAAELYGELLDQVLVLSPNEHARMDELLVSHYQQLGENGLAGVRPPTVEKAHWQSGREAAAEDGVAAVEGALGRPAHGAGEVFTLVDKIDAHQNQHSARDDD